MRNVGIGAALSVIVIDYGHPGNALRCYPLAPGDRLIFPSFTDEDPLAWKPVGDRFDVFYVDVARHPYQTIASDNGTTHIAAPIVWENADDPKYAGSKHEVTAKVIRLASQDPD